MIIDTIPIFVISLDRSKDRREYITKHLKDLDIDHKLFSAFDGNQLGIATKNPYLNDHSDWAPPYGNGDRPAFFVGGGINSLALSYFALAKMALALDYPEILIVEDDLEILPDFKNRFEELYRGLPKDYSTCHLEWCCVDPYRIQQITPVLAKGYPLCTAAVLYSKKGLKQINDNSILWSPYDIFLYHKLFNQNGGGYLAYPQKLCSQLSAQGKIPTTLT